MAAVFLHYILTDETKQGLAMMKFANNHWWKFDNWFAAYMVGFTQMIYVVLVEIFNISILTTNTTILDVIMNFLAIVVLTEFDNFFFKSVSRTTVFGKLLAGGDPKEEDDTKELDLFTLDDLLRVQVTTAKMADLKIDAHKL